MIFIIASPVERGWVEREGVHYCAYKFKNKSGKSTFFQKKQTCLSKNHFMYKINLPTGQAPKGDIFYVMIIQGFLR